MKNYYDILGVPQNATKEQIKSTYRKLSLKFHPDKNNGESYFESMFKNINEANEILTNDTKRANYDFQLKQFNDSKSNYANQAELRRKEEELRKRQEELFRKEQEIKRQQFSSEPETADSQLETETDWGKVTNFFLLLNIFLVFLIMATSNKNDKSIINRSNSQVDKANDQKSIQRTPSYKQPNDQYKFTDTTDTKDDYLIDSVPETKAALTTPKEDKILVEENIGSQKTENKVDSLGEKPKWFQFKKRKEWKKKKKEKEQNN